MSEVVEVTTRAAKVEALKLCSAYRINDCSKASTITGSGTSPKHVEEVLGVAIPVMRAIGSSPRRRRMSRATMVGSTANIRCAFSRLDAGVARSSSGSWVPRKLIIVRQVSMGWQLSGIRVRTADADRSSRRLARPAA